MLFIYVLKLTGNKYYIGKTTNPDFRLQTHFSSNYASKWTQKYKPICVLNLIPNCDNFDEDKYTLIYMKKFGIFNVRGGSFSNTFLTKQQIATINKQINTAENKCFKCGKTGHFANKCYSSNKRTTYKRDYRSDEFSD